MTAFRALRTMVLAACVGACVSAVLAGAALASGGTLARIPKDVKLTKHRLTRHVVLAGVATMLALAVVLAWGTTISLAVNAEKYYEDANANICVGLEFPGGFPAGNCSMKNLTTGLDNTALGYNVLGNDTSGTDNVALGDAPLALNTTGGGNVAIGFVAMIDNQTGETNTAIGLDGLQHNNGSDNTAVGGLTLLLNKTGNENTATGYRALAANEQGSRNVASGSEALLSNTTASNNSAFGYRALNADKTGVYNSAFGQGALEDNTVSSNTAVGGGALQHNTAGAFNVAFGDSALINNITGTSNVAIGNDAAAQVEGSNNVDISNVGVESDSGTTRIGTEGKQTTAYVAGIDKTAIKGCSVQVTGEGQLGCNNNPEGSAVATYASTAAVATGKCIYFTGRGAPGTAACPAATSGYSASKALSLAMPANGATVSNLAANTSATVAGADTAVVEVIDNTTSAVLLSCTVSATTKNYCTNNATTGSAAARDKLEVKITANGTSGAGKDWEVTFRY